MAKKNPKWRFAIESFFVFDIYITDSNLQFTDLLQSNTGI